MTSGGVALPDSTQPLAQRLAALEVCLDRAGWEICHIDLDLTGSGPVMDIRVASADGKWLLGRVDRLGRCTLERFVRSRHLGMSPSTKGRRPLSPQIEDTFLGRQRFETPAALLGEVGGYIENNPARPTALPDLRSAWLALLSPQARADLSADAPQAHAQLAGT